MKDSLSRALVPFASWRKTRATGRAVEVLPQRMEAARAAYGSNATDASGFTLVRQVTHLEDTEQVRRYLPDILGRALARIWIDRAFRERFAEDPIRVMTEYDVHLPATIEVEFVTEGFSRPRIVVYEQRKIGPRRRLLYLQMVMMAGT